MPFWVEKIGVPRTLAVEYPFGHIFGQPKNVSQQMRLARHVIHVIETLDEPGMIVHSNEIWPQPTEEAIKEWQPEVPAPVISHISKSFLEMMRKKRN